MFLYVANEHILLCTCSQRPEKDMGHLYHSLSFSLETGSFSLNLEIGMWPASFSNHPFSSSNSSGLAQPWLDPCPAFDTGAYDLNTGPYAWVPSGGNH